jgi:tetratricopeptide (TPR) repeat protein
MKKYYFILLILCLNLSVFAQKGSEKKANSLFAKRSYVKAAEMYEQLSENRNVLQNLGDCYYNNSQMKEAVRVYGKLFLTFKKDTLNPNIISVMRILCWVWPIMKRPIRLWANI